MQPISFLGIIPARYASTRFPGKPLVEIAGKPMIQWVYENASKAFSHIYVATDDERIAIAVEGFGGNCIMTSTSHQSGTDRCAEALLAVEKVTGISFEIVINIQGDEPFVNPELLHLLVEPFKNSKTQIATLVKPFEKGEDIFNPNSPKVAVGTNGNALCFSRSAIPYIRGCEENQWAEKHIFYKHIGLYAYRASVLKEITLLPQSPLELAESLEQLRWLENGYNIAISATDAETLAVDTPDDLEKVRNLISSRL